MAHHEVDVTTVCRGIGSQVTAGVAGAYDQYPTILGEVTDVVVVLRMQLYAGESAWHVGDVGIA